MHAYAEGPKWEIFDLNYPLDYIDVLSITNQEKDIVRFWERAGGMSEEKSKNKVYPQYTLEEINCRLRTQRTLRWDMALEDQKTSEGMEARAKFLESTSKLQNNYPSPWESLEPDKHSYARYDFVCKKLPQE